MIASLIVLLYLSSLITAESAITCLYIAGIILIIAELGVASLGALALNGLIALYAAYTIQNGSDLIFGVSVSWQILFGIALVELSVILGVIALHLRLRKKKIVTGIEDMIGSKATIIEWDGQKGSVRIDGEIWKATSDEELIFAPGDLATIRFVDKLSLLIDQ